MKINVKINNCNRTLDVEPGDMLVDVLRKNGYLSVKRACDTGSCGTCTILIDGEPIASCSYLAVRAEGHSITTIEGAREEAEKIVKSEGFDYEVNVYYGNFKFPRKIYEDIVLPEGYYDAVRIESGKAQGNNWWCVMFPPLCFVDFGQDKNAEPVFDIETERKLQEVLTQEEIEAIKTKRGIEDIKLKSKIYEFIEKGKVENTGINANYKQSIYAQSLAR